MVNIIVCMKQVVDPEAPVSTFQIDSQSKKVVQRGVPPVLNPFDENALEAALRIKEAQECKIMVLSLGKNISKAIIRKSLAAGADEVLLIEDANFENLDSCSAAFALAAAIKKIGNCDLILTGAQAADTNAGIAGPATAEILGIPSVTAAKRVELNGNVLIVERVLSDGHELIHVELPALITVGNELGQLRSINIRELMAAQKKPITIWNKSGLETQLANFNQARLTGLFIPQRASNCELIKGNTDGELGANLAAKLKEKGML